jgi:hypothetical protein
MTPPRKPAWAIVWDAQEWAFFLVSLRYGSRIRMMAKNGKAAIREAAARVSKQTTNPPARIP